MQEMRTRHSKSDFQRAPGAATVLGIAWFGVFPCRAAALSLATKLGRIYRYALYKEFETEKYL